MINLKIIISTTVILIFIIGCSGVKFLGAEKYNRVGGMYVERWFLNPDYKTGIPKGTAFYGSAADKIKDKFIVKYYIADENDSIIEIPAKDMWRVHDNTYLYLNTSDNSFKRLEYAPAGIYDLELIPISECYKNGWCKLHLNGYNKILYVKKI